MTNSGHVPTTLGALSDRVIEAGWLAALVVTPLLFNVYSYRTFDLDKVAVLRSIALIMAAAWIVKGFEKWRRGADLPSLRPWLAAHLVPCLAVASLAATALSTATSIAPRVSLWGSYERWQGLYTNAAYVVVFLSVVALVRTREQLERLITTALVVTLPVSLYAILQHFGADPVLWSGSVTLRAASTLGNPIFLSAFLGMTVPLTLYRLVGSARALGDWQGTGTRVTVAIASVLNLALHVAAWWFGPITGSLAAAVTVAMWVGEAVVLGRASGAFARVGVYNVLLSTQLAAMLLSQSRGPLLALVAGVFFFAVLWSAGAGRWKRTLGVAGAAAAIVVVVLVNVPGPTATTVQMPHTGRLGRMFDVGMQGRLLFWEGAWQLIASDPLRTVIGHGPETMNLVFPRFTPPAIARIYPNLALDRSHNETFDLLVTTGVIGLATSLLFLTGVVHAGMRALGLVRSPAERTIFLGAWFAGGTVAVLTTAVVDRSWRLSGIALPLGMLGGMVAYVTGQAVRRISNKQSQDSEGNPSLVLLVSVLLSAIVVHFVDIQVGIAVEATRMYFWTYAALLVVTSRVYAADAVVPAPRARKPMSVNGTGAMSDRVLVASTVIASFVLVTMVYDFWFFVMARAQLPSIAWLFVFTWLCGGLIVITEASVSGARPHAGGWRRSALWFFGMSLAALALMTVPRAIIGVAGNEADLPVAYYAVTLLMLVATALTLLDDETRRARASTTGAWLTALAVVAAAVSLGAMTNVALVRADIYYKQAWLGFHHQRRYEHAIAFSRRAVQMSPLQDIYHLHLGRALMEHGQRVAQSAERDALLRAAETSLERARDLSPLDVDPIAQLAHLSRVRAQLASDPAERATRFRTALALYGQAAAANPSNAMLWNEWGVTHFAAGDHEPAREKLERAVALDDRLASAHLRLGDLSSLRGRWEEAAIAYARAVARDRNSVPAHRALAVAYVRLGRQADAESQFLRVIDLAPNDLAGHRGLAQLYTVMKRPDRALVHAEQALAVAPVADRPALEDLIARLRQERAP